MGRPCGCCQCRWNLAKVDPATGQIMQKYLIRPNGALASDRWHATDLVALHGSEGFGIRIQDQLGDRSVASLQLDGSTNWMAEIAAQEATGNAVLTYWAWPHLAATGAGGLVWSDEAAVFGSTHHVLDGSGAEIASATFSEGSLSLWSVGDRLFTFGGAVGGTLREVDTSLATVHISQQPPAGFANPYWRWLSGIDPGDATLFLGFQQIFVAPLIGEVALADGWSDGVASWDPGLLVVAESFDHALGVDDAVYFATCQGLFGGNGGTAWVGQRDAATLATQWTVPIANDGDTATVIRIAAGTDRIFFGGNNMLVGGESCNLFATNASGAVLWTLRLPGQDLLFHNQYNGVRGLVYLPDSDQLWLCANMHDCHA